MGRPRFHPIRRVATAIVATATLMLSMTAPAAAMLPWQKASGDYDRYTQWHDASWWLKNRRHWVTVQHPKWTESYADISGQVGDPDRFHVWHYGDGSFDCNSTIDELTIESPKPV